ALHHFSARSKGFGGFLGPAHRWVAPGSILVEARGVNGRTGHEGRAIVLPDPRQRRVRTDAMNPCSETRAPLEGGEGLQHRAPGFLEHVLGARRAAGDCLSEPEEARPPPLHDGDEQDLVATEETMHEVGRIRRSGSRTQRAGTGAHEPSTRARAGRLPGTRRPAAVTDPALPAYA